MKNNGEDKLENNEIEKRYQKRLKLLIYISTKSLFLFGSIISMYKNIIPWIK